MTLQVIILLFFLYSFAGWVIEEIDILVEMKKLMYRGFLIGPICPIYGFGALMICLLLGNYKENAFMVFCAALIICSVVEYITSYVLEKIFNVRWWDYSYLKYNINGRVSLRNSFFFGLAGVLLVYFINPWLVNLLDQIDPSIQIRIVYLLTGLFIMDVIVSCNVLANMKKMLILENISLKSKLTNAFNRDNTNEISKAVREKIGSASIFHKKILSSFPKLKFIKLKKK